MMTAYKKNDITSPVKKKSGRKPNMNNREGCVEGLWETAKDCVETTQNCWKSDQVTENGHIHTE